MKTYLLAATAAAVLCTGVALAQPAPAPQAQPAPYARHARTETRADVQAHVQRMFARFDLNHDGFITKDEIASAKSQFAARMEQRRAGRAAKRASMFDRIDTNHDGVISREEFAAAPNAGRFGARMARMHRGFGQAMFDMADANKDGRVSLAEAQQLALQHFDRADINHDGVVTPDERKQARQLIRAQRHPA